MYINYPKSLNPIFEKLIKNDITPVIVGGYVRDALLGVRSNDIDIELYNIGSFEEIEKLLKEFGTLNSVGKSFGVCKLKYHDLELDFSLPRTDSKIASGHQGFDIKVDTSLDFKTAAGRRDFTINAMGYDIKEEQFLDPFNGVEDIKKRELKAVDIKKFDEDPLRVLRAIVFSSRFDFSLERKLYNKCKEMLENNVLKELPRERIFGEIKKIFLKSPHPSYGFKLLKELGGFKYFDVFNLLSHNEYCAILESLDLLKSSLLKNEEDRVILSLALLSCKFSAQTGRLFLDKLTNSEKLKESVYLYTQTKIELENLTHYSVYKLATKVDIELYAHYINALYRGAKIKEVSQLEKIAKSLNVYNKPATPLIQGKTLIDFGLQPSKEFHKILKDAYEAQIREEFFTDDQARVWLKKYLSQL